MKKNNSNNKTIIQKPTNILRYEKINDMENGYRMNVELKYF